MWNRLQDSNKTKAFRWSFRRGSPPTSNTWHFHICKSRRSGATKTHIWPKASSHVQTSAPTSTTWTKTLVYPATIPASPATMVTYARLVLPKRGGSMAHAYVHKASTKHCRSVVLNVQPTAWNANRQQYVCPADQN